jgi:hypothetical protein
MFDWLTRMFSKKKQVGYPEFRAKNEHRKKNS